MIKKIPKYNFGYSLKKIHKKKKKRRRSNEGQG